MEAKRPFAANHEIIEDKVVERAHNEFLQIFAELGIVGISIFASGFLYFGFLTPECFCERNIGFSRCLGGNCRIISFFTRPHLSAHFLPGDGKMA